jgi:hypothetical protein
VKGVKATSPRAADGTALKAFSVGDAGHVSKNWGEWAWGVVLLIGNGRIRQARQMVVVVTVIVGAGRVVQHGGNCAKAARKEKGLQRD